MAYTVDLMTEDGEINERGVQTYVRNYLVRSIGNVNDNPINVASAVGILWGSTYPLDLKARCRSIASKQRGGDQLEYWDVSVTYSTSQDVTDRGTVKPGTSLSAPDAPGGNSNQTAPNLRPWVIRWGSRERENHVMLDRGTPQKAVRNAAGQLYAGGIALPDASVTIHITAYRAASNQNLIAQYMNHVNDADFFGWGADFARCASYTQTSEYEGGAFFWKYEVEIEFKQDGWNPIKVLNAGTMYRADNNSSSAGPANPDRLLSIKDASGHPISTPVPLKADGTGPLPKDEIPNYIEFTGYYRADFSRIFG